MHKNNAPNNNNKTDKSKIKICQVNRLKKKKREREKWVIRRTPFVYTHYLGTFRYDCPG